jgi:hypothetical protein
VPTIAATSTSVRRQDGSALVISTPLFQACLLRQQAKARIAKTVMR